MEKENEDQLAILRENLQDSSKFASPEESMKIYRALHDKYQSLADEYYRQEAEFRQVSRYLVNQIEMLNQENHRLYMENVSLGNRHLEMLQRIEACEGKRLQRGACFPNMMRTRGSHSPTYPN